MRDRSVPRTPLVRRAPRAHLPGMVDQQIIDALADFYTPAEVSRWLDAPNPQLDGLTANAVIAAGRRDEVMAIINRLRDCVYL